ncbi:MAG: PxxKW family cysteine-rich protein [Trichlorobacter sp.]|nr:PxxKW family cysteine-rich protein [Trichlorobacter sp.]
MQCQTVLPGTECTLMAKSGCVFPEGSCQVVVENCEGCERIVTGSIGQVCSAYPAPAKKWTDGICNFATHVKKDIKTENARVNPMKTSKKGSGKK